MKRNKAIWLVMGVFGLTLAWTIYNKIEDKLYWDYIREEARWGERPAELTREYLDSISRETPHRELRSALHDIKPPGARPDIVRLALKQFVILQSSEYLSKNRDYVEQRDWPASFLHMLDQEIKWITAIRAVPPDEIYRLSQRWMEEEMPAKADGLVKTKHEGIASNLFFLALRLNSPMARHAFAIQRMQKGQTEGDPLTCKFGVSSLYDAAKQDYGPSMTLLAPIYRDGECITRDLARAHYWALRARDKGADMTTILEELESELSSSQRQLSEGWRRTAEVPSFRSYE